MVRRIPPDTDFEIVRAYLLGAGRDETAKMYSVSSGYVSKIWKEFKREVGPEGERLRDLSIQLRHDKITVAQILTNLERTLQPSINLYNESNK